MKRIVLTLLAASCCATAINAQGAAHPAKTEPSVSGGLPPADQKTLDGARSLVAIAELWDKPLDWSESGSATDQIIGHIRKALGKEAPPIELRSKNIALTTFQLKQAPLGPTLSSLAELVGARVWVLPGRLVLAPESALKAEERSLIERRAAGEWQLSSVVTQFGWSPRKELERVSLQIVGDEVKEKALKAGKDGPPNQYEKAFGELAPSSQKALQELVKELFRHFATDKRSTNVPPPPTIPASALVCIDDRRPGVRQLSFKQNGTATAFPAILGGLRWMTQRTP